MSGSAPKPEIVRLTWPSGQKMFFMEMWAKNVMADTAISKSALRVAWALIFPFNNSDNKGCWEKASTIGKRAGISSSTVTNALGELERGGHIIRSQEKRDNEEVRVIYPAFNQSVQYQAPRQRRGGVSKGVDPREIAARKRQTSPGRGTDLQDPAIMRGTQGQVGRGTDLQGRRVLTFSTHVSEKDPGQIRETVQRVRTSVGLKDADAVAELPIHIPDRVQRDPGEVDNPLSNLPAGQEAFEDREASNVEPGSPPTANAEIDDDDDFDDNIPPRQQKNGDIL